MNIEPIVRKIAEGADAAASQTLQNARERAQVLEGELERQHAAARQQAQVDNQKEAALLRERMLRMAALQSKKDDLAMKRQLIDEAFERALAKLYAMPREAAQALSLSLLQESAQGDEILLFGPGDEGVYDADFLARANAALLAAGKPGGLRYGQERLSKRGGFVLRRGGMQMEMTWDAVLSVRRDGLEAEVAALLFP